MRFAVSPAPALYTAMRALYPFREIDMMQVVRFRAFMKPTTPSSLAPRTSGLDLDAALAACARGDRAALKAIYDAEAPRMVGVAMRLLKDRALAEDAVHDAFVNIWNKAASFEPALGTGRTWIYAVLRNRALNMLRGAARLDLTADVEAFGLVAADEDPEAVVARLSDTDALKRCLEQLEPQRRNAIVLAYLHGLSHGELAGRLRVPLGTLKSWIRRGLLALKECLG